MYETCTPANTVTLSSHRYVMASFHCMADRGRYDTGWASAFNNRVCDTKVILFAVLLNIYASVSFMFMQMAC